jgi:hypothetical protein
MWVQRWQLPGVGRALAGPPHATPVSAAQSRRRRLPPARRWPASVCATPPGGASPPRFPSLTVLDADAVSGSSDEGDGLSVVERLRRTQPSPKLILDPDFTDDLQWWASEQPRWLQYHVYMQRLSGTLASP